jgi:hypothetical protein
MSSPLPRDDPDPEHHLTIAGTIDPNIRATDIMHEVKWVGF